MIEIESDEDGHFVKIRTEKGEEIKCSDLIITWSYEFGLMATLKIPNPKLKLKIKEKNISKKK